MKVAPHLSSIERGGAWRLCATLFLLLAFTLQAFITQTHIHGPASAGDRTAIVKIVGQTSAVAVTTTSDDTVACPFCQAMVVAGSFFIPTPLGMSTQAGLAVEHALPPNVVGLALAHASFSWRSRATPES